jgi:hypothetical protein
MSSSLAGAFAKLGRADEHLKSLVKEIERIDDAQPKPSVVYIEFEPPRHVVRVRATPGISEEERMQLALIEGDAVANLRTALDYLVCELVRLEGRRQPGRQNAFPVCTQKRQFDRAVRAPKYPKIGPLYGLQINGDAWAFIEGAQPYKDPDPDIAGLAVLARLSNRDKHRALYVQMAFPGLDAMDDLVGWNADAMLVDRGVILGPLSEEQPTDIAWFEFDPAGPDPDVHVKGRLPVDPTFGDDELQTGLGGLRTRLRNRVAELLDAAEESFFGP